MNERLEQEIELWKNKRCSYDERGDISATAQHFYNLALEEVKKEAERRIGEGSSKYDISEGAIALDSLVDFIDNQKQ